MEYENIENIIVLAVAFTVETVAVVAVPIVTAYCIIKW